MEMALLSYCFVFCVEFIQAHENVLITRSAHSLHFGWLEYTSIHCTYQTTFLLPRRMNAVVAGARFFCELGKELSYVDLMYTPFLERMSASLPYFKGLQIRRNPRWPNIDK